MTTTESKVDTKAPTIKAQARFSADRLRWVYGARAPIFEQRTFLQKILIDPAPDGGVYIVATNGALMMIAYDAKGTASHRFTFNPLEEIANLCGFPDDEEKLFNGTSYANIIVIDGCTLTACRDPLSGPIETIQTNDLVKVLSQEVEIGNHFPDWRPFVTGVGLHNPITAFVALNQIEFAISGIADYTSAITLTRYVRNGESPAHAPVHIAFEKLPLRGVLMPLGSQKGEPPLARCAMPFDAA